MLPGRMLLSAAASTSARSMRVAAASRFGGQAPVSTLFAQQAHVRCDLQRHAFSTATGKKDDDAQEPVLVPSLKTIDELIAENEALKKEVVDLKDKIAKAKPGLMATIKQYGMPFFIWWTGLYLATGVGFYAAFDTGILNGGQVIDVVLSMGLDKFIDPERLDPKHGNLALAIIVNEAIEPIRFPFAIATIPTVKKLLSRKKDDTQEN